ncbi:MAG TPA: proton-conducting transporter membrane subunit, partial [Chitinophagales bacterium]|nr:proton-conducting transporter membrane subunit [Chitinophagales bacterium]
TTYVTWYYLFAYSLSSIASFWVLMLIEQSTGKGNLDAFKGLVKRSPILAGTMIIALLSMGGIPPLAGFFAKYFVLVSVIDKGYISLAIIAILASLIGVYAYFRVIISIFSKASGEHTAPIETSFVNKWMLLFISILTLAIGIFPDAIFSLFFR